MDKIRELWRRIEAGMALHASEDLKRLAPGASEEDTTRLESVLGLTLPPDIRVSYRLHNGGFLTLHRG